MKQQPTLVMQNKPKAMAVPSARGPMVATSYRTVLLPAGNINVLCRECAKQERRILFSSAHFVRTEIVEGVPPAQLPPGEASHDIVSLRTLDGKASIEHQITIHVQDLFDIAANPDVSLDEVLGGLRYLMDFRIRKGRMPTLDLEVMKRLAEALMLHMSGSKGLYPTTALAQTAGGGRRGSSLIASTTAPPAAATTNDQSNAAQEALGQSAAEKQYKFRGKKLSVAANECFFLFVEFLEEVEEFRQAVALKSSVDLRRALRLHKRCAKRFSSSGEPLPLAVASVVAVQVLTSMSPHFADWHDLVLEESYEDVERALQELKSMVSVPKDALAMGKARLFPPPGLYFDREIRKIVPMFRTSVESGLSSSFIQDLLAHYGPNALPEPPKPSPLRMLLSQLLDFMVIILIISAIVEFAMNEDKPGIVLMLVVVFNVIAGFYQEMKANSALEALAKLSVAKAKVVRDGQTQEIDATHLVPGDIVLLEEGDAVPADLRIIESAQLEVIESILTGEPTGVLKSPAAIRSHTRRMPHGDCKGNAFISTLVARGRGKGLVVRTGETTEIGKIPSAITSTPNVQTSIQRKLSKLGKILVALAFLLCALVVVIGIAWKHPFSAMIKVGISLAVSVIPEGLVAVVTITMALGVSRMAARDAIVRKSPSVETLGSVTIICSDKTGTLTEGKMGAAAMWTVDGNRFSFTESTSLDPLAGGVVLQQGPETMVNVPRDMANAPALSVLAMAVAGLCNNADVVREVPNAHPGIPPTTGAAKQHNTEQTTHVASDAGWKPVGDPTEVALVVAAAKAGFSKSWWQQESGYSLRKLGENAFDSDRKVMSVVYEATASFSTDKPRYFVMAKGAPEAVLLRCSGFVKAQGAHPSPMDLVRSCAQPLDESIALTITDRSSEMASGGLRVLGMAIRQLDVEPDVTDAKQLAALEADLQFVGLIGLIDPPRKGVKESVATCKNAGIKVVMITGDHIATAAAIAAQLGILEPDNPANSRAIRGAELDTLSDEQIGSLRPFPSVFARVSPDNKLKIVKALQAKGHSVAMTGDGVNDAPAIKAADVGVAMGIGGTEITKQAANIVLANDNFSTIVAAVEVGRRVFDNIQKFIVYLLSCNSAEIWLMLICAIINKNFPFTTMVILWANIIADVPPAMALGAEPVEQDALQRKPRDPSAAVLSKFATMSILVQGWSMTLITFVVYDIYTGSYMPEQRDDGVEVAAPPELTHARGLAFAILTTLQLFQGFLSRSTTQSVFRINILGNLWMIFAVAVSFLLLLLGFYVPPLARWLELTPLPAMDWVWVLVCLLIHIVISELIKLAYRVHTRRKAAAEFEQIADTQGSLSSIRRA
ncbi:hypothetical protein RI367_004491 [Sorochytrium milnesiophthora]